MNVYLPFSVVEFGKDATLSRQPLIWLFYLPIEGICFIREEHVPFNSLNQFYEIAFVYPCPVKLRFILF